MYIKWHRTKKNGMMDVNVCLRNNDRQKSPGPTLIHALVFSSSFLSTCSCQLSFGFFNNSMGSPSSPFKSNEQPIYSTSPQSIRQDSPASFGQLFDRHGFSPSLTSEIDVVLDDGTLQRRRVSLTSLSEAAAATR